MNDTYWTLAYRNRRANHFKRVTDVATSWDAARELANEFKVQLPDLDIWVTTTRQAEIDGYTCAEDAGNILTDSGRRVKMRETGSLHELRCMVSETLRPEAVRAMVERYDYSRARHSVLAAARQGRATYLPAGARDNDTARVLIDGVEVGQASVLMAYVREDLTGGTYQERKLLEGWDWQLPV